MTTRAELLNARAALHECIRASEAWQPSYKSDRATFAMLLQQEAQLNTATTEYLHGLSDRALHYVDWSRLPQVAATNDPVANNDDEAWAVEITLLTAAIVDIIVSLAVTGLLAGEALYSVPMAGSLDQAILDYAQRHTAQLVTQVTSTSRDLIRTAIKQSIASGENTQQTVARLRKVVNNPVRAEMIAQTESVNGYQGGLAEYARATGAKSKTWDTAPGACAVCGPLAGVTIPIEGLFTLGNGVQIDRPSGHPRCRCNLIYNY